MPLFSFKPTPIYEPPNTLQLFLSAPLKFLIRQIYFLILFLRGPSYTPPPHQPPIRVVCISDTHCKTQEIPDGDLLIHAGDFTDEGTVTEIQTHIEWLKSLPHRQKVAICGNRDSFFDSRSRREEDMGKATEVLDWGEIHYLQHSAVTLTFPGHNHRTLNIYGAPQIPKCGGPEFAFQYLKHEDAWSGTIPRETDILVTHSPPKYHLDLPVGLGCPFLLREVWSVQPTLHVFGHIHAGYGRENVFWDERQQAYERVCRRNNAGILADMLAVGLWIDCLKVILYGVRGILWSRVWGGSAQGGIMVNAALTYRSTGKLGNDSQIVMI